MRSLSPESRHDAIAAALTGARRVLVTGFGGLPATVMTTVCDLAEASGAAIDPGTVEMARPAGPTIARAGEVTADREELRDRADLVIFWFCNPSEVEPEFIERFLTPPPRPPLRRRTLAVGPHGVIPPGPGHSHLLLDRDSAIDAARIMRHMLLHGSHVPAESAIAAPCAAVVGAIEAASCVVVVTDHEADLLGLEPWSIIHLIRTIAHRIPAFEIPLASRETLAAQAVLTWRYGAAGAIDKANRFGGTFLPSEASAAHLIERCEVDCVVAVGGLSPAVEQALKARKEAITVIRVDEATPHETASALGSMLAAVRAATAGSGGSR
ncbi:MAG: hypothetical protein ACKOYJ_11095 [Planctomycetia bacterium]